MGKINFTFHLNGQQIKETVIKKVVFQEYVNGIESILDDLRSQSYVGATGNLRAGWTVRLPDQPEKGNKITANIYNTADHAFNRIAGRSSGGFPPVTPLTSWVQATIDSNPKKAKRLAYVIGRKIARRGTDRWQSGKNFAGLSKDGTIKSRSLLAKAQKKIEQALSKIKRFKPL